VTSKDETERGGRVVDRGNCRRSGQNGFSDQIGTRGEGGERVCIPNRLGRGSEESRPARGKDKKALITTKGGGNILTPRCSTERGLDAFLNWGEPPFK